MNSGQDVELLLDTEDERLVLGSRGLASSLPVAVQGGLTYSPETRTVTGTFDKVRTHERARAIICDGDIGVD